MNKNKLNKLIEDNKTNYSKKKCWFCRQSLDSKEVTTYKKKKKEITIHLDCYNRKNRVSKNRMGKRVYGSITQ